MYFFSFFLPPTIAAVTLILSASEKFSQAGEIPIGGEKGRECLDFGACSSGGDGYRGCHDLIIQGKGPRRRKLLFRKKVKSFAGKIVLQLQAVYNN